MASYNRYNNNPNTSPDSGGNRGFFNKVLRNLSNFNMDTENMVIKNSYW